jgi:bifunctional non-homologous end joining protein LigD
MLPVFEDGQPRPYRQRIESPRLGASASRLRPVWWEYERADKRANFWYMIAMAKSDHATSTRTIRTRRIVEPAPPPIWVKPQLAKLVNKAPNGLDWLHEIKFDGYRIHARLGSGRAQILTRRGNDWTDKYPAIAKSIAGLPAQNAYLDGELCGVLPDRRTAFNLIQNATDTGEGSLVFFVFDLLHLNGKNLIALPLVDRKTRLASLLHGAPNSLRYNDHQIGHGPAFHRLACERGLEGIVSKRINSRYEPDRRSWLKIKCLNREEFVVVGWSDPEGSRHRIGALLLGYYTPEGKLIYAGRVGTGMSVAELERVWRRLQPLAIDKMPLAEPPPRGSRFGSPLVLSRVHWVRPEMVVEVCYVEWTPDGLLRHVVYLGEREDKVATEVRRGPPDAGDT